MEKHRIFSMSFAKIYPMYVAKAEKKGRSKAEVDEIIRWLTGYSQAELDEVIEWLTGFDESELRGHLSAGTTFQDLFADARLNPNAWRHS